jgi:hypothetical protein
MGELKTRINITCVSFTVSFMMICLTNQIVMTDINITEPFVSLIDIYQVFIINVFVNGSIFITDKCISIHSNIMYFLFGILQVYLGIILIGGVFLKLVPLHLSNMIYMAVLSIAAYAIVTAIVWMKNKHDENIINEKLKKGKKKYE